MVDIQDIFDELRQNLEREREVLEEANEALEHGSHYTRLVPHVEKEIVETAQKLSDLVKRQEGASFDYRLGILAGIELMETILLDELPDNIRTWR